MFPVSVVTVSLLSLLLKIEVLETRRYTILKIAKIALQGLPVHGSSSRRPAIS